MWIAVNGVGTVLYATQGLYFTAGLYAVLLVMAGIGWRAWVQRARLATPSEAAGAAAAAGASGTQGEAASGAVEAGAAQRPYPGR